MTKRQIEKPGKVDRRKYPKEFIYDVLSNWSNGSGEMASDGRTDRQSGDYMLSLREA